MSKSRKTRRGSAIRHGERRRGPAVEPSGTGERINVREALELHLVGEPGLDECWVHTHGMADFGLPELEIRSVMPRFLMPEAARVLMDIADHMLNSGETVRVGEEIELGRLTQVRLSEGVLPDGGDPDHYAVERWSVLDVARSNCPYCQAREGKRAGDGQAPRRWLN